MRITSKVKAAVFKKLSQYPVLRNSDDIRLVVNIWHDELPANLKNSPDVRKLFQLMVTNHFSNPFSVNRARRQIQEQNPSLRGSNYKAKQNHQKQIKEDLGYASS